ncbi:hypothetical protein [Sphingobium sp. DC-2]|uniref:hypothetical protein n=1 Tax=Sphingobium sp. DC-2 TaxID=1303256 RepID=UPI0005640C9C|nr:hypothetical protein [Sphingobium sp. DC-2]
MADDFAAVAVAQPSPGRSHDAEAIRPAALPASSLADRADRGVEILSRWAGILTFIGVVAGLAYLIF